MKFPVGWQEEGRLHMCQRMALGKWPAGSRGVAEEQKCSVKSIARFYFVFQRKFFSYLEAFFLYYTECKGKILSFFSVFLKKCHWNLLNSVNVEIKHKGKVLHPCLFVDSSHFQTLAVFVRNRRAFHKVLQFQVLFAVVFCSNGTEQASFTGCRSLL